MNTNKYKLNKQQQQQQRSEQSDFNENGNSYARKMALIRQQQQNTWNNKNMPTRNVISYPHLTHRNNSSSSNFSAPPPPIISNANFRNFDDNFSISDRHFKNGNNSNRTRQLDDEFERARANVRRHSVFSTAGASSHERFVSQFGSSRLEIDSDRDSFDDDELLRAQRRLLDESTTTTRKYRRDVEQQNRKTYRSRSRSRSARARNLSPARARNRKSFEARKAASPAARTRKRTHSPPASSKTAKHTKPSIITVILTSKDPKVIISQSKLSELSEVLIAEFTSGHALKPKFHGIYFKTNKLLLDCETKETVEWLKLVVPRLTKWQGPELDIIIQSDKSKSKNGKIVCFLLQRSAGENPKSLLAILEAQNEGINTSSWVILYQFDKARDKYLELQIDDASWRTIQKSNGSLYYRFGKVQIEEKVEETSRRSANTHHRR